MDRHTADHERIRFPCAGTAVLLRDGRQVDRLLAVGVGDLHIDLPVHHQRRDITVRFKDRVKLHLLRRRHFRQLRVPSGERIARQLRQTRMNERLADRIYDLGEQPAVHIEPRRIRILFPCGIEPPARRVHDLQGKVHKLIGVPILPPEKCAAVPLRVLRDLQRTAVRHFIRLVTVVGVFARLVPIKLLGIQLHIHGQGGKCHRQKHDRSKETGQ